MLIFRNILILADFFAEHVKEGRKEGRKEGKERKERKDGWVSEELIRRADISQFSGC